MPRPKGTKVVICTCGARVVGLPGKVMKCNHCGKKYTIPKKTSAVKASVKKPATVTKKTPAAKKSPVKKSAKKTT